MNNTVRKIVLVLLAVGATALILIFMGSMEEEKEKGEVQQTFKSVRLQAANLSTHKADVQFSGKITAEEKIDLFTEVGGVLLTDNFRVGNSFSKGQPIAQLNSIEFSNNLKASKTQLISQVSSVMGDLTLDYKKEASDWESFLNAINIDAPLPELPVLNNQKLKRYVASKGILNSYYSLKSQEEKLLKFSINAPYDGVLTQATIKKGTLVRAGQKIGEFINPSHYELETEVSLSDLAFISKGSKVELNSDDLNKTWLGTVARINSTLDVNSQMVKVFIKVKGDGLKEGMFLNGSAKGASFKNSILINRKLIKRGGLYCVKNGKVFLQPIMVLYTSHSSAIIQGLYPGQLFIADNMKGLYEGMKVNTSSIDIPLTEGVKVGATPEETEDNLRKALKGMSIDTTK